MKISNLDWNTDKKRSKQDTHDPEIEREDKKKIVGKIIIREGRHNNTRRQ